MIHELNHALCLLGQMQGYVWLGDIVASKFLNLMNSETCLVRVHLSLMIETKIWMISSVFS